MSGGLRSLPAPTLSEIRQVFRDYHNAFGRYPNLVRPRRFSEKIQWRKLFDLDPVYAEVTDKLAAREFIAARVGAAYLPPLLWTGDTPDDIPFDRLEPPYVLKCSHGSGYNVVVYDRATLDVAATREVLRGWLAVNYGHRFREPGYIPLRPRLLAERMMLEADGTPALEHKIFVFGGKARMIHSVAVKRERARFDSFHDRDWRPLAWRGINPPVETELARPAQLDKFLALAERLAAGFDHLRVDLYEWGGEPRAGELTPYNWSGLTEFQPEEAELALGEWWRLRFPFRRAVAAMLSF